MSDLAGVAIGIPAHDEAERIVRALSSVLAAARGDLPVVVVVAADSCHDDTVALARRRLLDTPPNVVGRVIELSAHRAGVAREQACRSADTLLRARIGDATPRWIATTDADTTVPIDWLTTHRRWAGQGADAIAGLVQVDPADELLPAVRRHLELERSGASLGHRLVFGANLGMTAAWWKRVGGFPAVSTGEDVLLIDALRRAGARVIGVPDSVVVTSGRLVPRAPNGFGSKLAALSA